MKIELNIPERYMLLEMLPTKGNFATMGIMDNLHKLLVPNEKELVTYEIKVDNDVIRWNKKALVGKEFELSDMTIAFVTDLFQKLSDDNELNLGNYMLYKKIVNSDILV